MEDTAERRKLVREMERIVLEDVHYIPGAVVDAERGPLGEREELRGAPNQFSNQKLQDV